MANIDYGLKALEELIQIADKMTVEEYNDIYEKIKNSENLKIDTSFKNVSRDK